MIYELIFSRQAKEDLSKLKKSEPQAFKKASKLLLELVEHPTTGSGKPEMLKGNRLGRKDIFPIYIKNLVTFVNPINLLSKK